MINVDPGAGGRPRKTWQHASSSGLRAAQKEMVKTAQGVRPGHSSRMPKGYNDTPWELPYLPNCVVIPRFYDDRVEKGKEGFTSNLSYELEISRMHAACLAYRVDTPAPVPVYKSHHGPAVAAIAASQPRRIASDLNIFYPDKAVENQKLVNSLAATFNADRFVKWVLFDADLKKTRY